MHDNNNNFAIELLPKRRPTPQTKAEMSIKDRKKIPLLYLSSYGDRIIAEKARKVFFIPLSELESRKSRRKKFCPLFDFLPVGSLFVGSIKPGRPVDSVAANKAK